MHAEITLKRFTREQHGDKFEVMIVKVEGKPAIKLTEWRFARLNSDLLEKLTAPWATDKESHIQNFSIINLTIDELKLIKMANKLSPDKAFEMRKGKKFLI